MNGHTETVHVVTANYADDPHPHVEGVYANEEDAKAKKNELSNSMAIAWKATETEVAR